MNSYIGRDWTYSWQWEIFNSMSLSVNGPLEVAFGFSSQYLEGSGNLRMVLYHSMNAGWVVGRLRGGRDTQTAVIKFFWTF